MYKKNRAPHVRERDTLENVMYDVVIALLPCMLSAVYYFKFRALEVIVVSVLSGLLTEALLAKLIGGSWKSILDGSGLVTTILLALMLPHMIPLWMVAVGSIFAVSVGKMFYGGLGQNLFNPALVGRIFMMLSFPSYLYQFHTADGTSGATVLPLLKYMGQDWLVENMGGINSFYINLFTGREILGSMGETNKLAILLGFLYLGLKKRIKWRVPLLVIGAVGILSYLYGENPLVIIMSGGLIFGAVYLCTDMVSGPVSGTGKSVFAIFVGTMTFLIGKYTSHPSGVGYAILLGNMVTPLINRYTEPRVYGKERNMKKLYGFLSIIALFTGGIFILMGMDRVVEEKKESSENGKIEEMREYIFQKKLKFTEDEGVAYGGYVFVPGYDEQQNRYYLVMGETKGYSNRIIKFALGITPEEKISGVKILEESETEGLGSKIKDEEWLEHWRGIGADHVFDKEKDAVAGATYTYKNINRTFTDVLKKSRDALKGDKEVGSDEEEEEKVIEEETDSEAGASEWEEAEEDAAVENSSEEQKDESYEVEEKKLEDEETDSEAGASEWEEGE